MTDADLAAIRERCEKGSYIYLHDALALLDAYKALQTRCEKAEGLLVETREYVGLWLGSRIEAHLREHGLIGGEDGK